VPHKRTIEERTNVLGVQRDRLAGAVDLEVPDGAHGVPVDPAVLDPQHERVALHVDLEDLRVERHLR